MSGCKLTILEGDQRRIVLLNEWSIRVGRDAPCDLILRSSTVSSPHCHLLRTHEGYVLEDLGSASGSFVNGTRAEHQPLSPGDEIRIGEVTILYEWMMDDARVVSIVDDEDPTMTFRLDFVGQESAASQLFSGARAASRISHLYTFIRSCAERGAEPRSEEEFLDQAVRGLCELPGVQRAQVITRRDGTAALECVATAAVPGAEESAACEVHRLVVSRVLQEGEAILCGERSDAGATRPPHERPPTERDGLIAVPLRREDAIFGLLVLSASPSAPGFAREDLEFSVAFARLLEVEIERRHRHRLVIAENRELRATVAENRRFVGSSPPIRKLQGDIDRAARSDATILILGESGTGKELVARRLHHESPRRDAHFVSVNCAVLQEDLLASDLFGHVKGAFTGAVANRAGKFELADGGTLFFDEIAELPFPLQAKLLRVLQEGEIERVGGGAPRPVDVRVIAATNRDIDGEVRRGAFREDLYFRLNVIALRVPPLRDRPGDLQLLLDHYVGLFARKMGRPPLRIPADVFAALDQYSWPGNVRELRNLVERCVVMSDSGVMAPEDFPVAIFSGRSRHAPSEPAPAPATATLDARERDHIRQVLEQCGSNKSRTAKALGIDRSTLYDKLRRLGIVAEPSRAPAIPQPGPSANPDERSTA